MCPILNIGAVAHEKETDMNNPKDWMWADALELLDHAERLHRRFFCPSLEKSEPGWEPPVDVIETAHEVLILTALPGVPPENVSTTIDTDVLVISGTRTFPKELRTATIHRLELPQGQFERRVALPAGQYGLVQRTHVNGCLIVSLRKSTRSAG